MKTDTTPEAAEVQIQLLRLASPARRFGLMCSLTSSAYSMARRAIGQAHPSLASRERDLLFVECHYGAAVARKVRAYLKNRKS